MRLIRKVVATALLLAAGQALALDVGNIGASPQLERSSTDRIQVQVAGPSHASVSFPGDGQTQAREAAVQGARAASTESTGFGMPEPADPPGWLMLLCAVALIAFVAQRKSSLLS